MNNLIESYIIIDNNNQKQGKVYYTHNNKKFYAEILFDKLYPKIQNYEEVLINGFKFLNTKEKESEIININGKEYELKELQKKCKLQADSYKELKELTEERLYEFSFLINY